MLVAGTQLSSIGSLEPASGRLWMAVAGFAFALAGVAGVILAASSVLTPTHTNLAVLVHRSKRDEDLDELDKVVKFIEDNPDFFYCYAKDLDGLQRAYAKAMEQQHAAFEAYWQVAAVTLAAPLRQDGPPPPGTLRLKLAEQAAEVAKEQFDAIEQVVTNIVRLAHHDRIRRRYYRSRPWLACFALVTAAGLAVLTWAANPAQPEQEPDQPPATARLESVQPAGL